LLTNVALTSFDADTPPSRAGVIARVKYFVESFQNNASLDGWNGNSVWWVVKVTKKSNVQVQDAITFLEQINVSEEAMKDVFNSKQQWLKSFKQDIRPQA
jgi:hypothetical protein